jgi:hypothetical protein
MWGLEANAWHNLCHDYPETTLSVDACAGFRYLEFNPRLTINSTSVFDKNITDFPIYTSFSGDRIDTYEQFAIRNQFMGVQYGVVAKLVFDDLLISLASKIALGVTRENLQVTGQELRTFPNGAQTLSQGVLLALPSNIGRFGRQRFGYVPDFDFTLAYPVWKHLTLKIGIEALYWNRIIRPTDQITRTIDITQIPNYPLGLQATPTGLNQPSPALRQSDLWLIGTSFGIEVVW